MLRDIKTQQKQWFTNFSHRVPPQEVLHSAYYHYGIILQYQDKYGLDMVRKSVIFTSYGL